MILRVCVNIFITAFYVSECGRITDPEQPCNVSPPEDNVLPTSYQLL